MEKIQTREENQALREAWDFVEHTGRSIFLTGKAGTGKTTFLKTVFARGLGFCGTHRTQHFPHR